MMRNFSSHQLRRKVHDDAMPPAPFDHWQKNAAAELFGCPVITMQERSTLAYIFRSLSFMRPVKMLRKIPEFKRGAKVEESANYNLVPEDDDDGNHENAQKSLFWGIMSMTCSG